MLTLHEHPFASYCWKALIALYEREVPFQPRLVLDAEDRAELARLWPPASIPVLVDSDAELTVPESTAVIEYLDRFGEAPPLVPADPAAALQARLWDRVLDGQVMTPLQRIVGDSLRPGISHVLPEYRRGRHKGIHVVACRGQAGSVFPKLEDGGKSGCF